MPEFITEVVAGSTERLDFWLRKANDDGSSVAVKPDIINAVIVSPSGITVELSTPEVQWDEGLECSFLAITEQDFPPETIGDVFTVTWSGEAQGNAFRDEQQFRVVESKNVPPLFAHSLPEGARSVLREVQARFADLQDAEAGGPHLAEDARDFNEDKYALLMKHAIERINTKGVVTKRFTLTSFPYSNPLGAGVLRVATTIEVIKHFILSYVEDPDTSSVSAPYASRRDYGSRWQSVLASLETEFDDAIRAFDRSLINPGEMSLLVTTRQFPGGYAERVRPSVPPWWRSM